MLDMLAVSMHSAQSSPATGAPQLTARWACIECHCPAVVLQPVTVAASASEMQQLKWRTWHHATTQQ